MRNLTIYFFTFVCLLKATIVAAAPAGFVIQVLDDQTHRGVPLVKLITVDQIAFYTDSAGRVFIDDVTLLNRKVFFSISSHGYEFPADGFGYRGQAFEVAAGKSATINIHRINIATRLYRLTGAGIYRDTQMAGITPPMEESNGDVVGQDTCEAVVYRGKIHWFFGDTSRLKYPLGQFGTSGATTDFAGVNPIKGIALHYFVDADGFSRRMVPKYEKGPGWLDGLFVLKDSTRREKMIANCDNVAGLGDMIQRQLLVYDDQLDTFTVLKQMPLDVPLHPRGQAFITSDHGIDYVYFAGPFPNIRVKADLNEVQNFDSYETFTCLKTGKQLNASDPQSVAVIEIDRDSQGQPVWGWKKQTTMLGDKEISALVSAGKIAASDVWFAPLDVDSKKRIQFGAGSVRYNRYLKKWVMIAEQVNGKSSNVGETWFSTAAAPVGPWKWVKKIVTHDRYSFYNPVHHDFLDSSDGRLIYFQGTYSTTFSGQTEATPRYDYNQIMYQLDLADPRLNLPN